MSEQGKLKQEIKENFVLHREQPILLEHAEYPLIEFCGNVIDILDEAKADFPKMYQPQPNIMEFYRWFKKYFGEGKP